MRFSSSSRVMPRTPSYRATVKATSVHGSRFLNKEPNRLFQGDDGIKGSSFSSVLTPLIAAFHFVEEQGGRRSHNRECSASHGVGADAGSTSSSMRLRWERGRASKQPP